MGKLKAILIDAEDFACENYNIPRNEFVARSWDFAKSYNLVHRPDEIHRHAIEYYDIIQRDIKNYHAQAYMKGIQKWVLIMLLMKKSF